MKIVNGDRVRVYVGVRAYVRMYVNNHYTKYVKEMMMKYIRNIEHLTPYFQST